MPTAEERARRAERSRRNGAKSNGPKTPAGLERARTAPLGHGLYATEETLAHLVDKEKFAELLRETAKLWAPENSHIHCRLNHLVGTMWELNRLIEVRRQYVLEKVGDMPSVVDLENSITATASHVSDTRHHSSRDSYESNHVSMTVDWRDGDVEVRRGLPVTMLVNITWTALRRSKPTFGCKCVVMKQALMNLMRLVPDAGPLSRIIKSPRLI